MNLPNIGADLASVATSGEDQEPRGAKNFLYFATQALNAKERGDHAKWANAVEQIRLEAQKENLALRESKFNERTKAQATILDLVEKNQSQDFNRESITAVAEEIKKGNLNKAFELSILLPGQDAAKSEVFLKYVAMQLTKDPTFQEAARLRLSGMDTETIQTYLFEKLVRGLQEHQKAPGLQTSKQTQTQTERPFLPAPVGKPLTPQHQRQLDAYMSGRGLRPDTPGKLVDVPDPEPVVRSNPAPVAPSAWTPQDITNYNRYRGQASSPSLEAEAARQRGVITPEEESKAMRTQLGLETPETAEGFSGEDTELFNWALEEGVLTEPEIAQLIRQRPVGTSRSGTERQPFRIQEYQFFRRRILNNPDYTETQRRTKLAELDSRFSGLGMNTFASDFNQQLFSELETASPEWGQAYNSLFMRTQNKSIPSQAFRAFGSRMKTVLSDPGLSPEQKNDMIYPAVQAIIASEAQGSDLEAKRVNGYKTILEQMRRVEEHIKQPRSEWDMSNTGFINSMILDVTSWIGHVLEGQEELATLDITNKATLAQYIQSISGLAVTNSEREFLESILFDVGDGQRLSESKIHGWRHLIGNYMTRYYGDYLGNWDLGRGMAEHLIGNQLPVGYFNTAGEFVRGKRPGMKSVDMMQSAKKFAGRIRNYMESNVAGTVNDAFKSLSEQIPLSDDVIKQLESLRSEINQGYKTLRESTDKVSDEVFIHIKNMKILEFSARSYETAETFIADVKKRTDQWSDSELREIWQKARGQNAR